jgi:G:T-mismatch repair DNA endonuclease (very short patch repair protein)
MRNRDKLIGITEESLLSRCEEIQAWLQKIRDAGYNVVSIWEFEFRKILCDNTVLKNEICSHTYVKH